MIYRLSDTRKEQFTQHFAFAVDIAVATARKVDTFKRTGFVYLGGENFLDSCLSAFFNDNRITRGEFAYILVFYIENGLYSRAFGGYYNYFFILIVESRTYTCGVAQHKSISVAYHSFHCITTIPIFGSAFEDALYIQSFGDERRGFLFGITFFFEFAIEFFYFIV